MDDILSLFKAMADENRLRIIKLLEDGELCVCDITAALDMNQSTVSFHLTILKEAGLIKDRKEGRWNHYTLDFADITNRVFVPTALERISGDKVAADKARLKEFRANKTGRSCGVR